MKQNTRKLMTLLLALAMVLTLLPVTAMAAEKITSVAITYDTSAVAVTSKLTGRQVTQALRAAVDPNAGPQAYVDRDYCRLVKKTPTGSYSSLGGSDDLLNTTEEYYFCFNVEDKNGGEWDVDRLPSVTVNGAAVPAEQVRWYTQSPTGSVDVYFRVIPTNNDVVFSVSVSAPFTTASRGDVVQCTAQVAGTVDTVNWTVIGANSAGTTVDGTGRLKIGSSETAQSLTVRATSTYDASKYGEATVNVVQTALSIDSVAVSPAAATVYRGDAKYFTVTVQQTGGADTSVTWSIVTPVSQGTFIDAEHGRLQVSADETAGTIILRATSVYDPSKYGEATVTLENRPKITSVAITYDASAVLPLTTELTGRQVTQALRAAVHQSAGPQAYVDRDYCRLVKKTPTGSYSSLGGSDDLLNTAEEYYFCFNVEDRSGYWWDVDRLPAVTVNGAAVPAGQMKWYSQSPTGSLEVYVPVSVGETAPPPVITSQPVNAAVAAGSKATFSVTAAGEGLTYQWQFLAPGGSWKNSGASAAKTATLSFTATAAQNGYQYRCIVTGAGGQSVTSGAATLTVNSGVTITTQPKSVTVAAGSKATFSVTASGSGLTYQWQYLAPGGSWKNSGASAARTATLSFTAAAAQNGYKYRCVVTSGGQSVTSSAATLTVSSSSGVTITAQPKSTAVAAGAKATFTVAASGSGLTYQWQFLAPGGSWKNSGASSAKTATLSFNTTAAQNGYKYRCVVKNAAGASVTSSAATLTVSAGVTITTQPKSTTVTAGAKATFTVKASGTGLTYQWQYLAPGGTWKNSGASSAKTATLSFNATAAQNGYKYRCIVTDAGGQSATSNAATLTVNSGVTITTQPKSTTVTAGSKATFTVAATGTGLTYQWQYLAPGGSWKNSGASSAKTATLSFTAAAAQNGYKYRCIVTDAGGQSATSSAATLTVG